MDITFYGNSTKSLHKMNFFIGLLALLVSESGLHGAHVHIASTTILLNDIHKNLGLNHMFMAENGTSLYLTGKNYIYHLDTANGFHDLTKINKVRTGPNDVANGDYKIDDVSNIVIPYGTDNLITCGSSYKFCHKRFLGNISGWTKGFEPSINNSAAVAFVTDFDNKEYLFAGCPHGNNQLNTICDKFGIFWFKDLDITPHTTKFKTADDLLLITETYVKGFAIDHHRLFFSIQRNKTDNAAVSRVANICQKNIVNAPKTYVDMELKCGDFNYMQAVAKTCFEGECIIVATFTQGEHSVVCAYLFSEIKSSLAVNVKRCYNKTLQLPSDIYDYFYYQNERPCTGNPADLTRKNPTDDYFLCNEDEYASLKDVIGDTALQMNASVRLDHTAVTALTLVSVRGRVLALLGTASGEIIKALVFPREVAEVLSWKAVVDIGHAVLPDMFVYGYTLYAFSENVVRKIELAGCSLFPTCEKCMESKNIFCGWCMFDNRCTTPTQCSNSEWILAESSTSICPHINQTSPDVLRIDESTELTLTLSHNLSTGLELRCQFESFVDNNTILMNSSVPEVERGDEVTVECRSPDWTQLEHHIEGTTSVSVLLFTNVSSVAVMRGELTVFECETFTRCSKCNSNRWTCKWCPSVGRCIKENNLCNGNETSSCPEVTDYTVSDTNLLDGSGDAHFAIEESYNITVKGMNLQNFSSASYQCSVKHSDLPGGEIQLTATRINDSEMMCHIPNGSIPKNLDSPTSLYVYLQSNKLDGRSFKAVFYQCGSLISPSDNCGQCKSFKYFKKYLRCHWCGGKCIYAGKPCITAETMCPEPVITKVYPLSAHINAVTPIIVEGFNLGSHMNETINAVSVGNISCDTIYPAGGVNISTRITCKLGPSERETTENVTVNIRGHNPVVFEKNSFNFQIPRLTRIFPNYGPLSGGTNVTIYGEYLDTGWERKIKIGEQLCGLVTVPAFIKPTLAECKTVKSNSTTRTNASVSMVFDNQAVGDVNFTYVPDPVVWDIQPRMSFESGGRVLTVTGLNLLSVQTPKLRARTIDGKTSVELPCTHRASNDSEDNLNGNLICRSPMFHPRGSGQRTKRSGFMEMSFIMDDVGSVRNLQSNISELQYYPDPTLHNFTETQRNTKVIVIKGQNLNVAATAEDVQVLIGCDECNVTTLEHDRVICTPPASAPKCNGTRQTFPIKVSIGFLKREVGQMDYKQMEPTEPWDIKLIVGGAAGVVLFLCVLLIVIGFIKMKTVLQVRIQKARKGYAYNLDKIEARYRNQCREEFAALQTAMVDLTSELEGGNVLFRDFDDFACKTLLSAEGSLGLMSPPSIITSSIEKEMEQFKSLLKSRQFLLTFIRALEKQNNFTIHDRSDVATYLMVINQDNVEFLTSILTDLLDELIDKNVAANTPKLLLLRSDSVAEKLLAHWLSICLYHYLKEQTGSVLFILYKAIKIQAEKGPVDYITSCAKYTLSEDKLFTETDQPKSLALEVDHFHLIETQQKTINVVVLDCDTITQAKGKMLEVLYKNAGYSQRPSVHATVLVEESDGTRRTLLDEDESSEKDGLWKKINTLQHYNVPDGARMNLKLNREHLTTSVKIKTAASTESLIGGSIRKSKSIIRTVSGSNFWHLMKHHNEDEEVGLASDFFLPRLLNTKGTLQVYIDDFFSKILHVPNDPPIIIKFLFDLLDSAANRCNITDPDVIHTWKCNSLMLRFWVNIIKNPDFVFDIHKPVIVDSCLSVIAQTLMDSCSTAESRLGPGSPSNKLLFARDIPRYRKIVQEYFAEMKSRPAVGDQELNSYLTQKISQKYSGKIYQSTALIEMFKFAKRYREKISAEMDNEEADHPGTFSTLSCKLQCIYMAMDQLQQ
ncbi:plexin-A1-like isoform X2 [Mya arenaria]|uniref:plexin-A1-like isoform X2 n=1 Tax=Mya arenaria TaxID=6604 RepID=UPI0022E6ABDA|nr:plexin-A1-like isoform X2 [Mya arenaria]